MTDTDPSLYRAAFASYSRSFRGEIYEFHPEVPMGKGYSNENKPFNIEEACYLKPVFRAIRNPIKRKIVIKKGVQALGTWVAEKSAAYFVITAPGEMAIYDCDIDAGIDHCKSRLMPMLKSYPEIRKQIEDIESRHDVTTTEFYFPGMTLRAWPLNESATQRITLKYVIIHDAFLSKNTGMIGQAIARTTQHPRDRKIIIESQGSDENDDFDREYKSTNQQMLYVVCPMCKKGQPFEWERRRDDGTYSGFDRGADDKVILPNGEYNSKAILRETTYECFYCREKLRDTYHIRANLDASSYYVAENPDAIFENDGFNWPSWINSRLPWGMIMLEYLAAKKAADNGNKEPLRQWYQKRAARTWSDKLGQDPIPVITGSYDPNKIIENEHHRGLMIDVQMDLKIKDTPGSFWYEAYVADKSGNSFQLDRGFVDSWSKMDEIQARWKIPNRYVCIDGGKWLAEILKQVAARRQLIKGLHPMTRREVNYWSTWIVLLGDDARSYRWPDKLHRVWAPAVPQVQYIINQQGKPERVVVMTHRWSGVSVKDQLTALRIGGEGKPKFVALDRKQLSASTQLKETGDLTYEMQMSAEMRTEKNGKPIYEKLRPGNHYNDTGCMRVVLMAMNNLAGHVAAPND